MDDDQIELIQQLCTRIGMIMEDASVIALVSKSDEDLAAKAKTLRNAIEKQRALIAAIDVLCAD